MVDYNALARIAYLQWLDNEDAAKEANICRWREYAAGEHPTYLTTRQKEFVGLKAADANHLYAHNLCRLVIDTVVERMSVTGFTSASVEDARTETTPLAKAVAEWWERNRMDAGQDELMEAALCDSEASIIVDWFDGYPRWTFNKAFDGTRGVRVHRDPGTDEIMFVSKRWHMSDPNQPGEEGKRRATLYFPDRVERYIERLPSDAPDPRVGDDIIPVLRYQGP